MDDDVVGGHIQRCVSARGRRRRRQIPSRCQGHLGDHQLHLIEAVDAVLFAGHKVDDTAGLDMPGLLLRVDDAFATNDDDDEVVGEGMRGQFAAGGHDQTTDLDAIAVKNHRAAEVRGVGEDGLVVGLRR